MIVTPAGWSGSSTDAYRFTDILHKFGESNEVLWWDAGATGVTHPVERPGEVFPLYYVASLYNTLSNAVFLFNFARVLRVDVTIEWLGQFTRTEGAIRDIDETGTKQITGNLEVTKFGTTLLAKMCHERFDRNRGDGNQQTNSALAPIYTFGWNHVPIIFSPDRVTTIDDRGTTPSGNLKDAPGVRLLRFTPERRVHKLMYKPINRLDKAGATFDLVKLNAHGAVWDDDMRSGCLWLAQQAPLSKIMSEDFGSTAPLNVLTVDKQDYFRITYNSTIKFFGQARNGQNNSMN